MCQRSASGLAFANFTRLQLAGNRVSRVGREAAALAQILACAKSEITRGGMMDPPIYQLLKQSATQLNILHLTTVYKSRNYVCVVQRNVLDQEML